MASACSDPRNTTATSVQREASAAQKVFDIAELFELIFQHLEFYDLLRFKRVSQTFHIHIQDSVPLHRKLAWLRIEPPSRVLETFLDFRIYFPHHACHGPFICQPRYSRDGNAELLYLHFRNQDPALPRREILRIVPESTASWRKTRVASNDVRVCLTYDDEVAIHGESGHKMMKAGTTLGDVYDWVV